MPVSQALATNLSTSPPAAPDMVEIETRFGRFEFPRANIIEMPQGVLGFSSCREFVLLELPDPRFGQFRLLQCTTEPALSFLVIPTSLEGCGIEGQDVAEALAALGMARVDTTLLLIVTIRKTDGRVDMTMNMRAPIVLDVRRQIARQYVLSNTKYSIRQRL
jgi:flagellar assembly factor FliW